MGVGTLRQILLLTDGCSNQGENPVESAAYAFSRGITVNVIGILEDGESAHSNRLQEVEKIAQAGGGMSRIVHKEALAETIQTVTRQAMHETLQGFIHDELSLIFGKDKTLEDVDPKKRGEIIELVEDVSETCDIEVLILVDTSASMHDKLLLVKEALIDLAIDLDARIGNNLFSVYQYPGRESVLSVIHHWAPQLERISVIFPQLKSGGMTPTGPAIREALTHFMNRLEQGVIEDATDWYQEG